MATTDIVHDEHAHDDHHDHPPFLAHHFDTPEQQFDAGKLGMWLFLVTEVLFFGGLFCAYALYRSLRPEVFEGCSEFLNTKLGAINTGVLLFSSLTMAWAVRCAQLRQHKMLTGMLAATLSCAAIFLGVKAIEYSHKWSMGLLPAGFYHYDPAHPHPSGGPNYLLWISAPFLLALIGLVVWLIAAMVKKDAFKVQVLKPLVVVAACFFVGVGLGMILESGEAAEHSAEHDSVAGHHDDGSAGGAHGEPEHGLEEAVAAASDPSSLDAAIPPVDEAPLTPEDLDSELAVPVDDLAADDPALALLAQQSGNPGAAEALAARRRQMEAATGVVVQPGAELSGTRSPAEPEINTPKQAGVFFSIYYCMTGVHAIHILAGMGVLIWLLVRAVRADFNEQYFGPVDYVGLYWHLVDLIWIYLFPLLYLIG